MTTREDALDAVEKLVRYVESASGKLREGLMDTPERVIKSYEEIYSGYSLEPSEILDSTFNGEDYNCLLYTSPSPRDLSTSRMPSSA